MAVPSAWPIRNERRHAALTRDTNKIETRLSNIESMVEQLNLKIGDVMNMISKKSEVLEPPPGLQMSIHMDYQERIERLETILVCSPPKSIQPTVSAVLDEIILHSIKEAKEETKERKNILCPTVYQLTVQ